MFNRHGKLLSISYEFKPALDMLRTILDAAAFKRADCEALERRHNVGRGTLIVLDVVPEPPEPAYADLYDLNYPYLERRKWLEAVLPIAECKSSAGRWVHSNTIVLVPNTLNPSEAWQDLQLCNRNAGLEFYEGLVAKRADAPYPIQLRSPDEESSSLIKHRWKF